MKKGQFGFLSKLILVVVSSVILVLFSTQLFSIIGSFSKESGCKASAIANSVGNKVSVGSDVIKLDCPPKYLVIKDKKSFFDNDEDFIIKDLDVPLTNVEKSRLNIDFSNLNREELNNISRMYRLNQIVANEMKTCWENMGQGKLNLFSSWFEYFADNSDEEWLRRMIPTRQGAPTICVICSRIDIDDDLYNSLESNIPENVDIDNYQNHPNSLVNWLTNNPVPKTSMSYYEYLQDDMNEDVFGFENRNFEYTKEPFAVIFSRTNVHALDQLNPSLFTKISAGASIFSGGLLSRLAGYAGVTSGASDIARAVSDIAQAKGSISAVYVVPYDDTIINEYCSQIAN